MLNIGITEVDFKMKPLLFNETRSALLSLFYANPEDEYYVNQIMQIVRGGSGAVQRELTIMTGAELIIRVKKGNLVYYRANDGCPVFAELKSMSDKGMFAGKAVSTNPTGIINQKLIVNPFTKIPSEKVAEFCQRHHIKQLSLFGSVLRDDFGPESDVDILVEFSPGHAPGYFRLFDMETEFSSLLNGRKADIRTSRDISRHFRDQIVTEAKVLYQSD